ncbi:C4-dicarboxylate ABC transporter permease [Corynebacterium sp. HMSC056F09]|uniref:TRAP transporter large permease n=1 Tax=Corynebacterium sp. HMSC056F09 TaxID=1739548 RepID=UPI0008A66302|nr:TRAP transporter large permease [Corynebacterium sp. HMSC056F09]OFO18408.1 C4-dicarboxylate ABC transporter permease [Corynebacterium sp. HMSC056F09]
MSLACLLITLFAALALGIPIAYSLLAAGLLTIFLFNPGISYGMIAQYLTTANDSFPILAVPFFILAGLIMGKGGISRRLFNVANSFVGHIPGGVGVAAVLTAMFFSAISGSGPATVAAIGGIMIPEMIKLGYSKQFSAALIASAGTIGVVIPPSIPLVIFGVVTGTSIGDLFLAAIVPGILMGVVLIGWAIYYAKKNNVGRTEKSTLRERLHQVNGAKAGLFLPIIILGGIYGGIFTPTEAAVIAVVYAVLVSMVIYKELDFRGIMETFNSAALTSSGLMIIVAAAAVFSLFLTIEEAPQAIVNALSHLSDSPLVIIIIVNLILVLLGTFMETIAAITIISPILVPVLSLAGMDPIQIGVIVVLVLSIGFITPPLGVNLFIASGVAKIRPQKTVVAIIPGFLLLVLVGLIVSFIPALSVGLL